MPTHTHTHTTSGLMACLGSTRCPWPVSTGLVVKTSGLYTPRPITQGGTTSLSSGKMPRWADRVSVAGAMAAKCPCWAPVDSILLQSQAPGPADTSPQRDMCQAPAHSRRRSPETVPSLQAERGRRNSPGRRPHSRTGDAGEDSRLRCGSDCQQKEVIGVWANTGVLERGTHGRVVPGGQKRPGEGPGPALWAVVSK